MNNMSRPMLKEILKTLKENILLELLEATDNLLWKALNKTPSPSSPLIPLEYERGRKVLSVV